MVLERFFVGNVRYIDFARSWIRT